MGKTRLIGSAEVAEKLGISHSHAYKVIRRLNAELAECGHMVIAGKGSERYLEERFFGTGGTEGSDGSL